MMTAIISISLVSFAVIVCLGMHYKHIERMKEKDIKAVEIKGSYDEDSIGDAYTMSQIANMLNMEDWKYRHMRKVLRPQILSTVKNLLDAVGEE